MYERGHRTLSAEANLRFVDLPDSGLAEIFLIIFQCRHFGSAKNKGGRQRASFDTRGGRMVIATILFRLYAGLSKTRSSRVERIK